MRPNSVNLFKLGSVVEEEMSFKSFIIWGSGGPPVQWSRTIYAMLKEAIMGNIHVMLYEIRISGSGVDAVSSYFLSGTLVALLFSEA